MPPSRFLAAPALPRQLCTRAIFILERPAPYRWRTWAATHSTPCRAFSQTLLFLKAPKKSPHGSSKALPKARSPKASSSHAHRPPPPKSPPTQATTAPTARSATLPRPPRIAATTTTIKAAQTQHSFASLLAEKGTPTELYEAPTQMWFLVSSYLGGLYCFGYAAFHVYSVYFLIPAGGGPPGPFTSLGAAAPLWIQYGMFGVCALMGAFGTFLFLGPARVVLSLRAVPAVVAEAAAGGNPASPVALEARVRRVLPFLPPRRIVAPPAAVVLPHRLAELLATGRLTDAQRTMAARNEAARRAAHEGGIGAAAAGKDAFAAPIRKLGRSVGATFWTGVRRAFTREGFAKVGIDGKAYKMDVLGGWALEEGRAVDRLVRIESR